PGMLPSHYAPRTPLELLSAAPSPPEGRIGLLWFGTETPPQGFAAVENISPRADLHEAAANLFAALHRLDEMGLKRICARPVPEAGLGRAINDRLRKAAA